MLSNLNAKSSYFFPIQIAIDLYAVSLGCRQTAKVKDCLGNAHNCIARVQLKDTNRFWKLDFTLL